MGVSVGVWRVSVGVCRVSGGVIGGYKTHMNSQNPRYNQYNHTSGFLPVPPNHSNYLKWSKFSDPMYGGSNELFEKKQNFPLFLNIKLHLKIPVNFNFLNILSFLGKSVPPLLMCNQWLGMKMKEVKGCVLVKLRLRWTYVFILICFFE